MRKTFWVFGAAAVVAALAIAIPAMAQPGDRGAMGRQGSWHQCGDKGPGGADGMMGMRLRNLNLTTDQQTRIRQIRSNAQKTIIPKRAEIQVKRIELRDLMHVVQPNKRQIEGKVNEISELQKAIHMLMIGARLDVRKVLTTEQLARFLNPDQEGPDEASGRPGRPARRMRQR